jgi:predicted RNA methylase
MKKTKLPTAGFNLETKIIAPTGLSGKFLLPPFSVLNAREGEWQARKRAWIACGIESEIGRGGELHKGETINAREGDKWEGGRSAWQNEGTSIFDPVLCELMYAWFCPDEGQIVDPFAGGSVRGIVAGMMGYKYYGIDLSEKQIEANEEQRNKICPEANITWICGDAMEELNNAPEADFIFSCPPYGDLERYSDDPSDLSTMEYHTFIAAYKRIIRRCIKKLKPGCLACFVVGDFRDKKTGNYRGFIADTIKAFQECGAELYNDAILVTCVGSLPIRAGRQFEVGRKLGKTHQNILVFKKGAQK